MPLECIPRTVEFAERFPYLMRLIMTANKPFIIPTVTDALTRLPGPNGERFATVFQHGTLLVEIYAPRGVDPQTRHSRDEIYFVAAGSGEFVTSDGRKPFGPTDVLFAEAGMTHRFENFSEDLLVWVLFYGPEGGEKDE